MANNSCKDCKDRYVGCHAKCDKYKPKTYEVKKDVYWEYIHSKKRRW